MIRKKLALVFSGVGLQLQDGLRTRKERRCAIMTSVVTMVARIILLVFAFFLPINSGVLAKDIVRDSGLGPQSTQAIGEKNVLIAVVRFPDATPSVPLQVVKGKAVFALNKYVMEQSYGLASINADFRGYVMLPSPLSRYKVSTYNNKVDAKRVRKLIEDTMTAVEKEVDFSSYHHLFIIPAVNTLNDTGYGMIAYCGNPGLLSPLKKTSRFQSEATREIKYETLKSEGGKKFKGGVFVGAENANLGFYAHDYFHALGGMYKGERLGA
jgi:hypothetical protein